MILTKELATATDQCTEYQFKSPFYPGKSCEDIYNKNPESHNWSGYYWITDGPRQVYCGMTYTGSSCSSIYSNNPEIMDRSGYYRINGSHWVYCTETCANVGGGWQRIVDIDISEGDDCPDGWFKADYSGYNFCRKLFNGMGCSPINFSTNGIVYHRVCGKARGYQKGNPTGVFRLSREIDQNYIDGLSITYGSPRQHIWTYAIGSNDNGETYCPCDGTGGTTHSFVDNNYYCESGVGNTTDYDAYHFDDPLWDGSGCIYSNCCSVPNQPWFYRQLSQSTSANIEARLCKSRGFVDGFTMIDQLELYIQ